MHYNETRTPLRDRSQTAAEIKRLIRDFFTDLDIVKIRYGGNLIPLSELSFPAYFNFIKNLPYKRDREPIEEVGRPAWVMEHKAGGRDCKKAAIMICAWLQYNRIPWRLIGSSGREDQQIHHIFPQADFGDGWINVDATYSDYEIGQSKTVTAMEVL